MFKISVIKRLFQAGKNAVETVNRVKLPDLRIYLMVRFKRIFSGNPRKYHPIDQKILQKHKENRSWYKNGLICYAPFSNLYFRPDGLVISCCWNIAVKLGKYPEQSVTNIWKGENLKNLRRHILHDDLSNGCNLCYEQMKAGNYYNIPSVLFDDFEKISSFPSRLQFELDNTCNLECIMCSGYLSSSIRKNRDKLPPMDRKYDSGFVENLKPYIPHLKQASFYGGEPFLIEIYYQIWQNIIDINPACTFDVQTNGTILNDKVKRIISKGNFKISVSFESLRKEVYESIRVNANFENVMQNILYFANYSKEKGNPFSIAVCPMRMNWKELPDIVSFCNSIGAFVYFHTVSYPLDCAIWNLPSVQLNEIDEFLQKNKITGDSEIACQNAKRYEYLLQQVHYWYNESAAREKNGNMFDKTGNDELEAKVIQLIMDYSNSPDEQQNTKQQNILKERLSIVLETLGTDELKKTLLITLVSLPPNEIYDFLKGDSYEMIKSILKIR